MDYTYTVQKIDPQREYMQVAYSSEGNESYITNFNPKAFDSASLKAMVEEFAPFVVEYWERVAQHPRDLPVFSGAATASAPVVQDIDFNYAPSIDPQPDYNEATQSLVMNAIENPMQASVGWTVIDLTPEQQAEKAEELRQAVRSGRNAALAETDWWMLSDTPAPTQAQLDYRQALRDVPQQAGFPYSYEWPEL